MSGAEDVDSARHLLVLEQQFDRMAGYAQHLREMHTSIFVPLDAKASDVLGFAPSMVFDLIDSYGEYLQERMDAVQGEVVRVFSSRPVPKPGCDRQQMTYEQPMWT
jgi:hypothetical protein